MRTVRTLDETKNDDYLVIMNIFMEKMQVLGSFVIGFALTVLMLAVGLSYAVILVNRIAWLCHRIEAFWKADRKEAESPPGNGAITPQAM